ncbi:MAG: alpha/beta hydrolase [Anaerolineaceae bacterium]|nr:alpha/beta hydrolase [Anaerolineaceae bacterium]
MSVIVLRPGIIHYEVLGRGRPVIFLHGWVGSWRYWMSTLQAASTTYRAYALDLWGFGESAKNPQQYGLDQQAALLDSFLNEVGIGRVALVGHGLGALVALSFSLQHPEIVDRAMAISCPVGEGAIAPRFRTSDLTALADWLMPGDAALTESSRLDAIKADIAALHTSLGDLPAATIKHIWERSSLACLWVHGKNDPVISAPSVEMLNKLPEHAHAILLEESGHFPMLEESSKFNRLLMDFLNLSSGESPRQLQLKEEWKRRVR